MGLAPSKFYPPAKLSNTGYKSSSAARTLTRTPPFSLSCVRECYLMGIGTYGTTSHELGRPNEGSATTVHNPKDSSGL
jgi:hypothetical protein